MDQAERGDLAVVDAATSLMILADSEPSITKVVDELCRVSRTVLSVEAACVMMLDDASLRFVHAAPEPFAVLGRLQDELQAGPCRDSVAQLQPVAAAADDLVRWPAMASAASALGVSAVISVPLVAHRRAWGSLDLYRGPGRWEPQMVQAATLFARIVAASIAGSIMDVSWGARVELEHRATHDALTDLPNRALLFDRLEHALLGTNRHRQSLAVMFIDLDDFKVINDSLGHAIGDEVLVDTADRLSSIVRGSDTLARLSGDEFVAICGDLDGPQHLVAKHLEELGQRIHAAMDQPFGADGGIQLTVSIGIAVQPPGPALLSGRHLLAMADRAMYEAKRSGRGRTVIGGQE